MGKILTEIDDGILTITINRPETLNAFDREVHETLNALWSTFEDDPRLRVAIVTGAGDKAFSAGSDIKYYSSGVPIVMPDNGYGGLSHRRIRKPIIAAVNGLALGGGFEFALCCDLILASENAQFGLPEGLIGAAALGGGTPRIMRRIPYGIALGLLLTGRRMGAADALRHGLVNEVVPRERLTETAKLWARDVVRCAPLAVEMHKRVAEDTLFGDMSWHDLLGDSRDARSRSILDSEDCAEGMRAFVEKRPPVWVGR
jgi:enoyl-CoA hydratase/carnithine racemase